MLAETSLGFRTCGLRQTLLRDGCPLSDEELAALLRNSPEDEVESMVLGRSGGL